MSDQGTDRDEGRGGARNCFNKSNNKTKAGGLNDLKEIGLWYGGSLVMNAIVGLGIFGTPKGVVQEVGSVGMTLLIWTFTGIFSMFAALCFVELRESVRKEGVEYAYITEAFGPLAGFVYSWMRIAAAEPSATALFSMVFTNYLTDSIYDACGPPESLVVLMSNLAIVSMCLVNVMSTKLSERVQSLATVGKTCALITIVVVGIHRMGNGKLEIIHQGMKGTKLSQSNLVFACYNGLWAYGGWSQVNHVTSGIRKPPRNVPRVVKTVIPLVLLLYLTVVLSYFTAMTQDDLLTSRAIGVTWAERVLGPAKPIVSIGVCLTALGSLNATFLSAGRLSSVAAKNGQMPDVASWVHVRSKTPLLVVCLKAAVAMLIACLASIQECLRFYIFCVWLFHGLSVLALLVLRYKNKHKLRPYKVDLWIPVVVVIVILYLLLIPFTQRPDPEFIAVVVLIFLSLATYYPVKWLKTHSMLHIPDTLVIWLQLSLRIAPKRELRRERQRSMIRRYLALDSLLHPEKATSPRPLIYKQFASLRYPRDTYNGPPRDDNDVGRQGEELRQTWSNLQRRRRGSSLRATDLKPLNSNSRWSNTSNVNNDRLKSDNIVRRKRLNRESHSFNDADVSTQLPFVPSWPILKNRFNTTPAATKDSEPGALASPSEMLYSKEVPPSFIYRSYRPVLKQNRQSLGASSSESGGNNTSNFLSEASSESSVIIQPKALPRFKNSQSEVRRYGLDYSHDRRVFFDSNESYSSSSDNDDDDADAENVNDSFGNLRHTFFASIFGTSSSSSSSTDDEEEEEDEEEEGGNDTTTTNNGKSGKDYRYFSNLYQPYAGYNDPQDYIYNISEKYNDIRRGRPKFGNHAKKDVTHYARPTPRKRASLLKLKNDRPQPAPRRSSVGTREAPYLQLQVRPHQKLQQPQPQPRRRRHHKHQIPSNFENLNVSYV